MFFALLGRNDRVHSGLWMRVSVIRIDSQGLLSRILLWNLSGQRRGEVIRRHVRKRGRSVGFILEKIA